MINNLDKVLLSAFAVELWHKEVKKAVRQIADSRTFKISTIPDEDCEFLADGSLRIFVKLPNEVEVSLVVSPTDWAWRMPNN